MGVRPLPGRENLFQSLEYIKATTIPGESTITLADSAGHSYHSSQITAIMAPGDSVYFSGEVVFAGYGYMNTDGKIQRLLRSFDEGQISHCHDKKSGSEGQRSALTGGWDH